MCINRWFSLRSIRMQNTRIKQIAFDLFALYLAGNHLAHAQDLRLAILGTDSSHAVEFVRMLNDPSQPDHVGGAKVISAYRGGSDIPISRDRIEKFSESLAKTWSIPFVPSIPDLCKDADGILVLSVDTSLRMRELSEAAKCGKPLFVDKPLGGSLADARQVAAFLDQQHIPWFSSSSIRYGHEQRPAHVVNAETWGPDKYTEGFPLDLAYYGLHTFESLYSIMGPGVKQVSRAQSSAADLITVTWTDGRIGTVHLVHNGGYGSLLFLDSGQEELNTNLNAGYAPLLEQIVKFMRTGHSPVPEGETLEIFAAMNAATQSLLHGGMPIAVNSPDNKPIP